MIRMNVQPSAVTASRSYYIKLGRGGDWEVESLRDGVLRFGYREAPHDLCMRGDWQAVWEAMKLVRGDAGAATRDVNQIRAYYEADEQSIFITFVGGLLYWARPTGRSNFWRIAAIDARRWTAGATRASAAAFFLLIGFRADC